MPIPNPEPASIVTHLLAPLPCVPPIPFIPRLQLLFFSIHPHFVLVSDAISRGLVSHVTPLRPSFDAQGRPYIFGQLPRTFTHAVPSMAFFPFSSASSYTHSHTRSHRWPPSLLLLPLHPHPSLHRNFHLLVFAAASTFGRFFSSIMFPALLPTKRVQHHRTNRHDQYHPQRPLSRARMIPMAESTVSPSSNAPREGVV